MPTEISAPLHFRTMVTGHTYLIADFYATWCPPCKAIAPVYEQLSKAHSIPGKIAFVKVNVDEQQEIAAQNGIQAMPTFLVFKDGKKIEEIKGANPPALKKIVERIAGEVKAANVQEKAPEQKPAEEKTVSGSYGMTSNNSWKMSLN
ncbi:thioredoxin-domain-containing protein [Periconia macrospinosa]|uniref:Thioredoxin-domain-containing protein n=1 Tax=Periconia macrospinosa TaxID=97972 RepID=A0A2V1DNN9_9PLEO|nr:thioredoxin-domain-containing protein [Periconia macrospinosa]